MVSKFKVGDIVEMTDINLIEAHYYDYLTIERTFVITSISSMGMYRCQCLEDSTKMGFLEREIKLSKASIRNNKLDDLGI